MKENDVPARFVEYAGASHGFFNYWPAHNPYFASTLEQTDQYLTELGYLSGQPNVRDLYALVSNRTTDDRSLD